MAAEFDSLLARSAASTGWAAGEGVPDQLEGANYTYDARWRLSSRTVINATAPDAMTGYIHDLGDHIIAETDAIGATQREYIWLDDLPVAAVDGAARSPVIYYVHTDHLQRPVAMTNARQSIAWSATYTPFGAVQTITTLATNLNLRFPANCSSSKRDCITTGTGTMTRRQGAICSRTRSSSMMAPLPSEACRQF